MTALTIPELAAICLGPNKSPWPLKDLLGLYKVKTLSLRSLVDESVRGESNLLCPGARSRAAGRRIDRRRLERQVGRCSPLQGDAHRIEQDAQFRRSHDRLHFLRLEDGRDLRKFCLPCEHLRKERRRSAFDGSGGRDTGFISERRQRRFWLSGREPLLRGSFPNRRRRCLSASAQELFAAGALIKLGLALFSSDNSATPPGSDPGTPTQSGQPPAGVDPGDPPTAPIDPASLPDSPPPADANTPVATTGGGGGGGGTSDPNDPDDPGETQPGVPGDPGAPAGSPTNPSGDGPPDGLG